MALKEKLKHYVATPGMPLKFTTLTAFYVGSMRNMVRGKLSLCPNQAVPYFCKTRRRYRCYQALKPVFKSMGLVMGHL